MGISVSRVEAEELYLKRRYTVLGVAKPAKRLACQDGAGMKRIIFTAVLFFLIGQEWREYERKKLLNELKIKSGLPICFMDLCDQARGHKL